MRTTSVSLNITTGTAGAIIIPTIKTTIKAEAAEAATAIITMD